MRCAVQAISAQARFAAPGCEAKRSGRRQNWLHTQKALMEYRLLAKVVES
jgi:hypothetical protein